MACINMYTPSTSTSTSTSQDQQQQQQQNQGGGGGGGSGNSGNGGISMSPRISFSSDFILDKPIPSSSSSPATPGNPDFEFAVGTRPMMAADELFFKGRLLPLRHGHGGAPPRPTTTLRDELRAGAGADDVASRPKPCPPKWKGLLGLKKVGGHYGNKKHIDKSDHVGAASSFKFASSTQEVLEEEEED